MCDNLRHKMPLSKTWIGKEITDISGIFLSVA